MQTPDSLADAARVAADALQRGAEEAQDGDLGAALLDWALGIVKTMGALVAVEEAAWVGLVALVGIRASAVTVYGGKHLGRGPGGDGRPLSRRTAFKRMGSDTLSLAFVLLAVTVGGNAVPILGWTILIFWSWAIGQTVKEVARTVSPDGSALLSEVESLWAEVKRRNLAGVRSGSPPSLPGVTPGDGLAGDPAPFAEDPLMDGGGGHGGAPDAAPDRYVPAVPPGPDAGGGGPGGPLGR